MGVLPSSKSNFAGIQYQYREFSSGHHATVEGMAETARDQYHTAQLWGRYNIFNYIQVFAFVPYVNNVRKEGNSYSGTKGLGDVTLLVNYRLLGANCNGKIWQSHWLAGGGVKLPTGMYNRADIRYNEGLPNMQAGTASYDFVMNSNYTLLRKSTGINTDLSFVATTPNKDRYKFGNRFSAGLLFFHNFAVQKVKLTPQAGLRYDYAGRDYSDYYYSVKNSLSGGSQLYASTGLQAFRRNIGVQAMYSKPVAQNYAGGMVINKYKTDLSVFLLF